MTQVCRVRNAVPRRRSGPARPIRWAPPTTAPAPTSRCSARSPSGSSCACSTPTAAETRLDAARGGRVRLARLPARTSSRASATATGCTARTIPQPATGATRTSCCSTRTPRRSTAPSTGTSRCSATTSATRTAATTTTRRRSMPKSVVINPFFDWGVDRPPGHEYADTVIYEAHVKGLTADASRHPGADARHLRRRRAPGDHRAPASRWASPRSS